MSRLSVIIVALCALVALCYAQAYQVNPDILNQIPHDDTDTSFRGWYDFIIDYSSVNYYTLYVRPEVTRTQWYFPQEPNVDLPDYYSSLGGVWYLSNFSSGSLLVPSALIGIVMCFL